MSDATIRHHTIVNVAKKNKETSVVIRKWSNVLRSSGRPLDAMIRGQLHLNGKLPVPKHRVLTAPPHHGLSRSQAEEVATRTREVADEGSG